MKPKKALGQHWLIDRSELSKVINAGDLNKSDTILEIGPGLGTLTEGLLHKCRKVIAVEIDEHLVHRLRERFSEIVEDVLEIVHQDILSFDLRELPKDYKVVANIPYYLTSNLIRLLLESNNPPKQIVLLVQKEVAERITANPGNMSVLALSIQFYAQARSSEIISKDKFTPPPKVDSMVVVIDPHENAIYNVDKKKFFRVMKAGFVQKRKQLKNSLSSNLHISMDATKALLSEVNIDHSARPQELSIDQWVKITNLAVKLNYV